MKAAGKKADTPAAAPGGDGDDIVRLLRALNEDLKADPADHDAADLDEDLEAKVERQLPFGKIAAALVAAAAVGFAVVMLDHESETPAPQPPPTPLIAAAPAPGGASTGGVSTVSPVVSPAPKAPASQPEPLIARAPTTTTSAAPAPALVAPQPPSTITLPQTPPPALRVPEPPPIALPAPTPVEAPAKLPDAPPPALAQPEPVKAAPPAAPPVAAPVEAPKPVQVAKPTPVAPAPATAKPATETAELQAMLAPKTPPRAPAAKREVAKPEAAKPDAPKPLGTLSKPASTAPAESAGTAEPTTPDGRYAVQVGSFQMAENAEALVRRLRDNGYSAVTLDWTDAAQKSWHAVRVGGYADPAAAKRAAGVLKGKMGLPAMVVSTH